MNTENTNRPAFVAVTRDPNDATKWNRIGAAWPVHGKGYNIRFEKQPDAGTTVYLRHAVTAEKKAAS